MSSAITEKRYLNGDALKKLRSSKKSDYSPMDTQLFVRTSIPQPDQMIVQLYVQFAEAMKFNPFPINATSIGMYLFTILPPTVTNLIEDFLASARTDYRPETKEYHVLLKELAVLESSAVMLSLLWPIKDLELGIQAIQTELKEVFRVSSEIEIYPIGTSRNPRRTDLDPGFVVDKKMYPLLALFEDNVSILVAALRAEKKDNDVQAQGYLKSEYKPLVDKVLAQRTKSMVTAYLNSITRYENVLRLSKIAIYPITVQKLLLVLSVGMQSSSLAKKLLRLTGTQDINSTMVRTLLKHFWTLVAYSTELNGEWAEADLATLHAVRLEIVHLMGTLPELSAIRSAKSRSKSTSTLTRASSSETTSGSASPPPISASAKRSYKPRASSAKSAKKRRIVKKESSVEGDDQKEDVEATQG